MLSRGAKDGVRTRDLDLGKVALYQLSYFRIVHFAVVRRFVDAKVRRFRRLSSPKPEKILETPHQYALKTDYE